MPNSPFHHRYIAFVDILGFGNLVKLMEKDSQLYDTVRDALKMLTTQASEFHRYRRSIRDNRKKTEAKGKVSPNDGLF